jgi:hypothetical protein
MYDTGNDIEKQQFIVSTQGIFFSILHGIVSTRLAMGVYTTIRYPIYRKSQPTTRYPIYQEMVGTTR